MFWIKFSIIFLLIWNGFFALVFLVLSKNSEMPLLFFIVFSIMGFLVLASWLGVMRSVKRKGQ